MTGSPALPSELEGIQREKQHVLTKRRKRPSFEHGTQLNIISEGPVKNRWPAERCPKPGDSTGKTIPG